MAWLISYCYRASYKAENGIRHNQPGDAIELIDEHPALFLANARQKLHDLEDAPYEPEKGLQRADTIDRVYWSIEIPDGMLTDEQRELFE